MLLAAAVVPTPPLLIPEVAGGSASRDQDLRAATLEAVNRLLSVEPDRAVVVGEARTTGLLDGEPDWHPFGVPLPVPRPDARLPLALGIGVWLLRMQGCLVPVEHLGVAASTAPEECAELGRELVAACGRTALLVCGDGTATRNEKAPGHFSPDAAGFDARVDEALRAGDPAALLELGMDEARELWSAGRPAWQVLAGAADGSGWDAQVTYAAEPYAVHYVVATWSRRET